MKNKVIICCLALVFSFNVFGLGESDEDLKNMYAAGAATKNCDVEEFKIFFGYMFKQRNYIIVTWNTI